MKVAIITTDNREPYREYHKPAPWFGTAPQALLQGLAQLPEIEVHVISCTQQPMVSPEKLAGNIFFHSLHVPKIGWMRTLYQGCVRTTKNKLREIRPNIVHGQGTERECALGAVFSGFPNVLTIHGNMRLVAKVEHSRPLSFRWIAARLEAFTIPRSQGVVCITNYTHDAVADLAKKTWVVPNAVDAGFFDVQPEINLENPKVILCVGAVGIRKNQNAFIRALDPLVAKRKFQIVFLGSAPQDDSYCREFFELVAARDWCRHFDFVGREKLKAHLRKATLLALPSLEDNCPMAVLEAAAANVPVVAAKVGGVPDLIEDGKTGLFCDPQNSASMASAAEKMLAQPEFARALAAEAKMRAKERFHPLVVARRHLEIYREVLAANNKSLNRVQNRLLILR
jgi:glycosyltransferase involved in cell wall biosynthesis